MRERNLVKIGDRCGETNINRQNIFFFECNIMPPLIVRHVQIFPGVKLVVAGFVCLFVFYQGYYSLNGFIIF
jgi:hypothetical protein